MKITAENRSKRRTIFPIFAAALFLLCGILTAIGLFRLQKMAAAYELSSPEGCVRTALSLFQNGDYDEIVSLGEITLSEFETVSDLKKAIQNAAPGGSYTFSKTNSGYRLFRGDTELAELTLSCQKGVGEYGFDIWDIDTLTLTAVTPQSCTVTASPKLSPMVNGIALSDGLIDDSATKKLNDELYNSFGCLPEQLAPQSPSVYRIDELYCTPTVTAETPYKGKSLVRTLENNHSVILYPGTEVITEVSETAAAAAEAYAKYITNDAVLDEVLPYFVPESQYYKQLKEFYNGWYNSHDSYSFEQPRFAGWQLYDDDHVSCVILFNYKITMGQHQYEYPSKYNMSFVRTQSGWRLSNLVVV